MKTRVSTMFSLIVSVAVLLAILPGGIMPTTAQEPEPPYLANLKAGSPSSPNDGPYQTPEGLWVMPDGVAPPASINGVTPQATGGPDDFGYTWDDSVALNWIDASGGTETGIDSSTDHVGPIDVGFSIKYYENIYSQLYISRFGFVTFNANSLYNSQSRIPSPEKPDDVIAPHWVPAYDVNGYVRYLSGGTAPNRWFVIEWNRLESDCCGDDAAEEYTFEVVLYENGDIVFQYGTMTVDGGYWCQASGIEDSTGLDGLSITDFCRQIEPNHAVHIYRPAPSARVSIRPLNQGRFTHAGETVSFKIPIRNTGEFGADTYDLSVSSPWPVGLYAADGATLLTDTDSDGTVDTGTVAQGGNTTVVVKVTTPAVVNVGDHNSVTITARSSVDTGKSKTVSLQTAVPAPFAQVYRDNADGAMSLDLVQPDTQVVKKVTSDWHYGYYPAVAEMPDSFAYFWTKYDWTGSVGTYEIEYTLLNRYGQTVRGVSKLTNHTGATVNTYDYNPAVAVAPNGNIGVLWYRYLYDYSTGTSRYLYNIYFAILDNSGNLTYGPVNLTNNSDWYQYNPVTYNVPCFYDPRIAATGDNRFVLAWESQQQQSDGWLTDIYYAVRDTNGGGVKRVTKFTNGVAGGNGYYYPTLTALNGNRVLLAYGGSSGISYAVLDSAGNIVKAETSTGGSGWGPDVTQFSNGAILLAWASWGTDLSEIAFAVLDGTTYNVVAGPTTLSNPAAVMGDAYVSVTADSAGHAILTWMDSDWSYRPNLYYALIDSNGNVLTDPVIFRTSQATNPYIETSYEGYGNTSYSLITPTTDDVDSWATSSLVGAAPGGTAAIPASVGNYGSTPATAVVLTATLDSNLGYTGASPVPTSVSGDTIVWNLANLGFLGNGRVILHTTVPSATIGTRYPVTWMISSAGPEYNPADNTIITEVMVAHQVFLPLVFRSY